MIRSALLATVFLASFCYSAVGDTDRGAQLAASCAACHRLDGHSVPPITGRSADQLVATLKDFKSEGNKNHVMRAIARSLSDEEIQTIARYLSTIGKQAEQP